MSISEERAIANDPLAALTIINNLKAKVKEIEYAKERANDLGDTLENGLNVISESLGVSTEHYDTDQADTECYLDCFKDAATALKKFGIKFDDETGEFIQVKVKCSISHCSKCGDHIDTLATAGKYLNRTSPLGENFVGQCAPFCEYHEIKADGNTALINCLNDNT